MCWSSGSQNAQLPQLFFVTVEYTIWWFVYQKTKKKKHASFVDSSSSHFQRSSYFLPVREPHLTHYQVANSCLLNVLANI